MRKTLKDCLPHEFTRGEFDDTEAYKYRDVSVVAEFDGTITGWPGKHKNVYKWIELENGKLVGWNENPARGWSFPVIKKIKTDVLLEKLRENWEKYPVEYEADLN